MPLAYFRLKMNQCRLVLLICSFVSVLPICSPVVGLSTAVTTLSAAREQGDRDLNRDGLDSVAIERSGQFSTELERTDRARDVFGGIRADGRLVAGRWRASTAGRKRRLGSRTAESRRSPSGVP